MKNPTGIIQRWLAHDATVQAFEVVNAKDTGVLVDLMSKEAYVLSVFSNYKERRANG